MLESLITFSRDSASQQQVTILLASSCYDVHIIHWGFAHQQPLGFLITLTRSTHSRHCLLQLHNILFFRRHRMYLCDALYFANVFSLIGVCPIKGTPDSAITESNGAWRVFNFVHSVIMIFLVKKLKLRISCILTCEDFSRQNLKIFLHSSISCILDWTAFWLCSSEASSTNALSWTHTLVIHSTLDG